MVREKLNSLENPNNNYKRKEKNWGEWGRHLLE